VVFCAAAANVDVDDLKKILMFKIPAKSPAAINKCQQALKQATTS
jgi:hypothetical protein